MTEHVEAGAAGPVDLHAFLMPDRQPKPIDPRKLAGAERLLTRMVGARWVDTAMAAKLAEDPRQLVDWAARVESGEDAAVALGEVLGAVERWPYAVGAIPARCERGAHVVAWRPWNATRGECLLCGAMVERAAVEEATTKGDGR